MKKILKSKPLLLIIISLIFLIACDKNPQPEDLQEQELETYQEQKKETENKKEVKIENKEENIFEGYEIIEVDGGDQLGHREALVAVDIGFGKREYWAFTNEHGQLVRVIAEEIILQDEDNEPVKSNGRYYWDEAKVPGTESSTLDEGHVIADSLGGVSNAYNITPQESTLNRHGDQAYMENAIRKAGGCSNFEAIISYATTTTHIPSKYKYTYTLKGNVIVDEFNNINPDELNKEILKEENNNNNIKEESNDDISEVDTNNNGRVTIAEAKAAGYKMPISSSHWLYEYMTDRDWDGFVGE